MSTIKSEEGKNGLPSKSYPTGYTSKVSIPLPSDDESKRVMGASFNSDTTLNVIRMFSGTADMYTGAAGLISAVFHAEGIDPRVREIITLRSAKILNCPYQWQANVKFAGNVGISDDEISAVTVDGPVTGINPEYVLLCRAIDEMCTTGTLTDPTLTEMMKRYDVTHCRKVILIISWFNLVPRFLNTCRVPLETTDKIGGGRSAPL